MNWSLIDWLIALEVLVLAGVIVAASWPALLQRLAPASPPWAEDDFSDSFPGDFPPDDPACERSFVEVVRQIQHQWQAERALMPPPDS